MDARPALQSRRRRHRRRVARGSLASSPLGHDVSGKRHADARRRLDHRKGFRRALLAPADGPRARIRALGRRAQGLDRRRGRHPQGRSVRTSRRRHRRAGRSLLQPSRGFSGRARHEASRFALLRAPRRLHLRRLPKLQARSPLPAFRLGGRALRHGRHAGGLRVAPCRHARHVPEPHRHLGRLHDLLSDAPPLGGRDRNARRHACAPEALAPARAPHHGHGLCAHARRAFPRPQAARALCGLRTRGRLAHGRRLVPVPRQRLPRPSSARPKPAFGLRGRMDARAPLDEGLPRPLCLRIGLWRRAP